jgi:hypothetical protein
MLRVHFVGGCFFEICFVRSYVIDSENLHFTACVSIQGRTEDEEVGYCFKSWSGGIAQIYGLPSIQGLCAPKVHSSSLTGYSEFGDVGGRTEDLSKSNFQQSYAGDSHR